MRWSLRQRGAGDAAPPRDSVELGGKPRAPWSSNGKYVHILAPFPIVQARVAHPHAWARPSSPSELYMQSVHSISKPRTPKMHRLLPAGPVDRKDVKWLAVHRRLRRRMMTHMFAQVKTPAIQLFHSDASLKGCRLLPHVEPRPCEPSHIARVVRDSNGEDSELHSVPGASPFWDVETGCHRSKVLAP